MWHDMLRRCMNPTCDSFPQYGGRGIRVCDRWRESFEAFALDMGPRPKGSTLERADTNGDYEPPNCRWATLHEQARNRRDNVWITFRGETRCLADWSSWSGISVTTLHYRIHNGWDTERALTTPPRQRRSA